MLTKSRPTSLFRVGRMTTTNASSTTTKPSTSPLTVASRRNTPPRPPTTPSSSFSTRWAWKTRTSFASWASPKRPSAFPNYVRLPVAFPQSTGFCRMVGSRGEILHHFTCDSNIIVCQNIQI